MPKKHVSILAAVSLIAAVCIATALTVYRYAETAVKSNDKGLSLAGNRFGGAFIKVDEAGLEAGKKYTIDYLVKSTGTSGFRVRYTDGDGSDGNFSYNDEKTQAYSARSAIADGTAASQIPAYFWSNTIGYNETKLLTVDFTFGAEIEGLDPLTMDYIGFFGLTGGDSYRVLGMRLKDASGAVISFIGDMNLPTGIDYDATESPDEGKPGTYARNNFFTFIEDGDIKYQLHRPAEPEEGKKYPLLIRLHGSGLHDFVEKYPIMGSVGLIEDFIEEVNTNPEQYESYVVMAVSPEWGPEPDEIEYIIQKLIHGESVDPDRVYIYGFSMGGYAASDFIMAYPNTAAAAVLICGASELTPDAARGLVNLPLRIYHSDDDDTVPVEVSRNFYNVLLSAGGNKAEYYEVTGFGHYAWNYAYKSDMVEWMFNQRRNSLSEADSKQ